MRRREALASQPVSPRTSRREASASQVQMAKADLGRRPFPLGCFPACAGSAPAPAEVPRQARPASLWPISPAAAPAGSARTRSRRAVVHEVVRGDLHRREEVVRPAPARWAARSRNEGAGLPQGAPGGALGRTFSPRGLRRWVQALPVRGSRGSAPLRPLQRGRMPSAARPAAVPADDHRAYSEQEK
jgi:hypothetical protein